MKIQIFDNEQTTIVAFATFFLEQAQHYIQSQGQFNVVLSGGSSPKKVYELLASPAFNHKIDWTKVNFYFGDERFVPADDPQNNGLMVELAMFKPLQISKTKIFKIDTSRTPTEAAENYIKTLTAYFKEKQIHFDLVLLGLGDNAHTASLFPNTEVLSEKKPTVKAVYLKQDNTYRISMSAPLINQAKNIAYLVFGESKTIAVQQVINGATDYEKYPAQLIHPESGELYWFLDKNAARFLSADSVNK